MMDAFLKLEGINGESHDDKHKDWIDVLSFTWGMSQAATAHLKSGSTAARASVNDVQVVKQLDVSSVKIAEFCTTGQYINKATIDFCKAGGKQQLYLQMKMDEVIVSSYSLNGSSSEQLDEVVTLNFAKYGIEYWMIDNTTGQASKSEKGAFDIRANKKP